MNLCRSVLDVILARILSPIPARGILCFHSARFPAPFPVFVLSISLCRSPISLYLASSFPSSSPPIAFPCSPISSRSARVFFRSRRTALLCYFSALSTVIIPFYFTLPSCLPFSSPLNSQCVGNVEKYIQSESIFFPYFL